MSVEIRWQEEHMDWEPLRSVVGEEGLGDWMWMHRCDCPETGAVVHFYKHSLTRRYLRLDADGRVYRETRDGAPVPLPGCGGATLLLLLLQACAHLGPGLPATVHLPAAAREESTTDGWAILEILLLQASDQYRTLLQSLEPAAASLSAHGRSGR